MSTKRRERDYRRDRIRNRPKHAAWMRSVHNTACWDYLWFCATRSYRTRKLPHAVAGARYHEERDWNDEQDRMDRNAEIIAGMRSGPAYLND